MHTEKKKRLTFLILFAAVIVIAFYVFDNRQVDNQQVDNQSGSNQEETAKPASEVADVRPLAIGAKSPDPEETVPDEPAGRSSYRVKNEPAQAKKPVESREVDISGVIDWEIEHDSRAALDSALRGNVHHAVAVSELINQCLRGFDSEQQTQAILDSVAKRVASGNPVPPITSFGANKSLKFNSFEAYEQQIWTQFAQCDATRGMFDQQLREQLLQMAESGSVSARYMYAMWPPGRGKTPADQLLAWLIYQNRAMEFTWANINLGEPLGMLAFGQSLESPYSSYFTARNSKYGQAFILAAQKCSMEDHLMDEMARNVAEFWTQRQVQYFVQMDDLAEGIADMFCR